jgi:GTP-binding protein EngB required for normal cell division
MADNGIAKKYLEKTNDWLQLLFSDYGQKNQATNADVETVAQEAVRQLQWMKKRLLAEELHVGFVGLTNTGKSTLLNALFGESVAPKWNGPCSSAPVEFRCGDRYRTVVHYKNSIRRIKTDCASAADLCEVIKRHATETGGLSGNTITKLVAEIPNPLLANRLVIADTPGFGAAQVQTDEGRHQQSLLSYLPNVHQVFWVMRTDGSICLSKQEKDFYDQQLSDCCDDLVVTGMDHLDNANREQFRQQFKQYCCEHLGVYFLRFHFVSGKQAVKAKQTGDETAIQATGIRRLETRLTEVADTTARPGSIAAEMMTLCSDFGAWLNQFDTHSGTRNRWATGKVEWLNVLHFAGLLEPTDSHFTGWRNKLEIALAGKN